MDSSSFVVCGNGWLIERGGETETGEGERRGGLTWCRMVASASSTARMTWKRLLVPAASEPAAASSSASAMPAGGYAAGYGDEMGARRGRRNPRLLHWLAGCWLRR